MEPSSTIQTDHDLLIELKTTVGFIRTDLKDMKDGVQARITALEIDKIGRSENSRSQAEYLSNYNDHESRIRALEKGIETLVTQTSVFQTRIMTWGSIALLLLGVLETAATIYFK